VVLSQLHQVDKDLLIKAMVLLETVALAKTEEDHLIKVAAPAEKAQAVAGPVGKVLAVTALAWAAMVDMVQVATALADKVRAVTGPVDKVPAGKALEWAEVRVPVDQAVRVVPVALVDPELQVAVKAAVKAERAAPLHKVAVKAARAHPAVQVHLLPLLQVEAKVAVRMDPNPNLDD
jgi:hypothetical protein